MKNFLSFGIFVIVFFSSLVFSSAKFVSGYNDGINTYAVIEYNGRKYRTDKYGADTNIKLWNNLSQEGKKKLMKYYYSPNDRALDFGSGSASMAKWANDTQGWSKLVDKLKQKRANKSYPKLKSFYDKSLKIPSMSNVKCTDAIRNTDLAKESSKLRKNIEGNYNAGKMIYKKLINIKWEQIGVAVKGVSANLIPIIVDNFMTGFITNGASEASQMLVNLYSFFQSTRDFAKQHPNDAATLIKKLDTLTQMMATDAATAKSFVKKDIEKLQRNYKELAKLCKEDYENQVKFEKEKKKALQKMYVTPVIDTNLKITSSAKTKKEREEEICRKAETMYRLLDSRMRIVINSAKTNLNNEWEKFQSLKIPVSVKICGSPIKYATNIKNCLSISHYSVKEIQSWKAKLPKRIKELEDLSAEHHKILNKLKSIRDKYVKKAKQIQSRKNELLRKYKKCLVINRYNKYIPSIGIDNTISSIEISAKETKIEILKEEDIKKKITEGLKERIDMEIDGVRPYRSLESNFVNSLIQIRDAVRKIDKIYLSEEIFTVAHHYPKYKDGIKRFKAKISLFSIKKQNKIKKELIKRLRKNQKKIRYQVKRLIIGQNNARDDFQKLTEFLTRYTGQGYNFSDKLKKDVLEVTGVKLKRPYYDIVEDWQNGDYMLWMQGDNSWILKPKYMIVDIESIIKEFSGDYLHSNSLEALINDISKNRSKLLTLSRSAWSKKFNEYSSRAYKIINSATTGGVLSKNLKDVYAKFYNMLNSINYIITNRERVKSVYPLLRKDINDASAILEKKENNMYDSIIQRLRDDTKIGTEAYRVKDTPEIAKMFKEINVLVLKLKNAKEELGQALKNRNKQYIRDFYQKFKEVYESKDTSSVVSLLSDDWGSSADGVGISDLEDYLNRSFRLFDSIIYNVSNLNIQKIKDNLYRVSYALNIEGEIYDDDIVHVEKSSVQEEVQIKNGKVKILKTLNGRFWSVK